MLAPLVRGSSPKIRRSPLLGRETAETIFMVDVLPAPLGPKKPKLSPAATSKSMAFTARNSPKSLVNWRADTSEGV